MELNKKEQDLIILAHFQAHRGLEDLLVEYVKFTKRGFNNESRFKINHLTVMDYFSDILICCEIYFFSIQFVDKALQKALLRTAWYCFKSTQVFPKSFNNEQCRTIG